jgi:S1-C subfamily serine protease
MLSGCFIFLYVFVLNSFQPVFAQSSSRLHSRSIWNMAKQIQEAKTSVVRIYSFYSDGKYQKGRASTGFIYNEQGFLVTRANGIKNADSIAVSLSDGRESPAWIVYYDRNTELALLKISLEELSPMVMGSSSDLSENMSLALLGNSLGFFPSLTLVKFLGVDSDGMLKLSALVPPGNCGSPLFNQNGENVGIFMGSICQKYRTADENVTDIGLPIERVRCIMDSVLSSYGDQKGWIGVSVVDVKEKDENKGVKVIRLVPGGPADQGKICVGDVIVEFEGRSVQDAQELAQWVQKTSPNRQVKVLIRKEDALFKKNIQVHPEPWGERKSCPGRP